MMAEYVEFTDFGAQNESSTDDGPLPITSLVPMESIYMPPLVRLRFRVRRIVESIWMRLLSLLLVVIDAIVLLVRLSEMKWKFDDTRDEPLGYQIESYFVIAYFVLEVCCRIFALGPKEFFSRRIEVLDFVIIMLSAVLTFVFAFGRIVVVTRLIRIVIIFRLLNENHQLRKATRLLISQNKRRYREDGFDLDLTFVTNRIIAMSYPSSGLTSVYRNPVKEVIRFFNTKYPEHYMLYNLCSERQYDPALFNGRVECFGIDDHNVPTLNAMVAFCENASAFLEADPGNIIAVHCKGGKGRTGTMICALLLYMKQQPTADVCLCVLCFDPFPFCCCCFFSMRKTSMVSRLSQNRHVDPICSFGCLRDIFVFLLLHSALPCSALLCPPPTSHSPRWFVPSLFCKGGSRVLWPPPHRLAD
eukprot:m.6706 g.6706  ORF g.6706 m.6706 type:complete len:416 (-) comp2647_c0_seq3:668-1915(-)